MRVARNVHALVRSSTASQVNIGRLRRRVVGVNLSAVRLGARHRVDCCYPDHASLLETAAKHAGRVLAFSYPRERWYIRFWLALENGRRRLFGNPFRTFVHGPAAMEARVTQDGFVTITSVTDVRLAD